MSYRPIPHEHYQRKKQFFKGYDLRNWRKSWQSNLSKSLMEVNELKNKGWSAQSNQTYIESDAKKIAEHMQQDGFETKTVPVAKWGEEDVVFLLFKRKPKSRTRKKTSSPPQLQPASQFLQGFLGVVSRHGHKLDPDFDPSKGAVVLEDHSMMAGNINDRPHPDLEEMYENIDDALRRKEVRSEIASDLLDTIIRSQKDRMAAKGVNYEYGLIFGTPFNLEKIKQAVEAFGDTQIKLHVTTDSNLVISNNLGNFIVISPLDQYNASKHTDQTMLIG